MGIRIKACLSHYKYYIIVIQQREHKYAYSYVKQIQVDVKCCQNMHTLEHNYICCHIIHILNAELGTGGFFVGGVSYLTF